MSQLSPAPLVERWRRACALVEGEGTWAEPESVSLVESLLAASRVASPGGSVPSATGPDRGEPLSGLDRATRIWARQQPSLPVLALRLSRLRQTVAPEMTGPGGTEHLDHACRLVEATATEEFTLRLQQAALTDPLTGAGNRRALDAAWRAAVAQGKRTGRPACLVAIDLDGLKRINDFQGHAAGDEAIVNLCAALRAAFRDTDEVFRMGGDEFVALLPGTAAATAGGLMGRVTEFNAPRFSWGAADTFQDGTTLDGVLGCADRRLYAQRRRDRPANASTVVVAPAPGPTLWSRLSPRRAVELAVTGALALAIGAIVTSISGGNHSLCSGGQGPTVVDCGLSNAVYYGGMVLMAAGGFVLGVALVARALRRVDD